MSKKKSLSDGKSRLLSEAAVMAKHPSKAASPYSSTVPRASSNQSSDVLNSAMMSRKQKPLIKDSPNASVSSRLPSQMPNSQFHPNASGLGGGSRSASPLLDMNQVSSGHSPATKSAMSATSGSVNDSSSWFSEARSKQSPKPSPTKLPLEPRPVPVNLSLKCVGH